jgi:hypothetical protein
LLVGTNCLLGLEPLQLAGRPGDTSFRTDEAIAASARFAPDDRDQGIGLPSKLHKVVT